ncbi:RNA 3'-terminal phosphate cyclase [Nitrosopumilus sp.]|uniref:RNA 3'-terminal phosphate cyclase n=1 Tax=Nitrosopumilus sp. TaxID=2024843 RepID=UPI0026133C6F|nr:RNA 3'-terminal phosphate cyclase [Nitrosopumilus sp.]
MDFVEINGGHGEGGGQIIRSATTLSCITKKPVHIVNIRKYRKVSGLKPQHITAIKILQKISNAEVIGNYIGSTELKFIPKDIKSQKLNEDVGTAGSISLILQTIIPLAVVLKEKLQVKIRGGTDVLWSPTINYSEKILKEVFRRMGLKFSLKITKRGYFPKGEGEVELEVFSSKVNSISLSKRTSNDISILCTYSKIPLELISKEIEKIESKINENFTVDIEIKEEKAIDSGSSLLAYSIDEKTIFGIDSLFDKKNKKFDFDVEKFLENSSAIDENLADMLVLPASLASGKTTFEVKEMTSHLETNLFVTSKITGCRYGIGKLPKGYQVIIEGISYSSIK